MLACTFVNYVYRIILLESTSFNNKIASPDLQKPVWSHDARQQDAGESHLLEGGPDSTGKVTSSQVVTCFLFIGHVYRVIDYCFWRAAHMHLVEA